MKFLRSTGLLCALALAGGLVAACGADQSAAGPGRIADARDDYHSTVREATAGLDGHTLFRPADLNAFPDHSVPSWPGPTAAAGPAISPPPAS